MTYIERNLIRGESVVYLTRLHWVIFITPFIWLTLSIMLVNAGAELAAIGGVFAIVAIFSGISSIIRYKTSEFGITSKRVIIKTGFIRRDSLEILLNKVEGIQVNQGIVGRILGYGSIVVSGTGGTRDPFHKIRNPLEFRRRAQEQIESSR